MVVRVLDAGLAGIAKTYYQRVATKRPGYGTKLDLRFLAGASSDQVERNQPCGLQSSRGILHGALCFPKQVDIWGKVYAKLPPGSWNLRLVANAKVHQNRSALPADCSCRKVELRLGRCYVDTRFLYYCLYRVDSSGCTLDHFVANP